jgi:E3 ubiquitin-protein transferase RMND5
METALKELEKLQKLVSDEPSTGKTKTPAIQESLNSLLQTLHVQKKRLEAGLATEAELTLLARTVEARKKEIDERQKEIYNSLARYGKALDKVSSGVHSLNLGDFDLVGHAFDGLEVCDTASDV